MNDIWNATMMDKSGMLEIESIVKGFYLTS